MYCITIDGRVDCITSDGGKEKGRTPLQGCARWGGDYFFALGLVLGFVLSVAVWRVWWAFTIASS